jgi:hypothetical protein
MAKGINLLLLVLVLLTSTVIICAAQPLPGGFQGNVAGPGPFNSDGLDYMDGQPDIQSGQTEPDYVSLFGGYGENGASAQDQFYGGQQKRTKSLTCSIWTDKKLYLEKEKMRLYYRVSKPCYVKIVVSRPDGKFTLLDTTWTTAGTHSIAGIAKQPFGKRTLSLKAWTNRQRPCYKYYTYEIGSKYFAYSDGEPVDEPSDGGYDEYGKPVDEPSDGGYDEYGEPVDELSDGGYDEYGEPVDEPSDGGYDEYGEPVDEPF